MAKNVFGINCSQQYCTLNQHNNEYVRMREMYKIKTSYRLLYEDDVVYIRIAGDIQSYLIDIIHAHINLENTDMSLQHFILKNKPK